MDLRAQHPDLVDGLESAGFSVHRLDVGNAYAVRAEQRAQPDLPPYFFVPQEQWQGDALARQKADVLVSHLSRQPGVVHNLEATPEALSELYFNLLGIGRAIRGYSARYRAELNRIVTSRVRLGVDEVAALDLFSTSADDDAVFILLAPGGWGKTSFCRYLATATAEQLSPRDLVSAPFPVFVEFTREVEALPFADLLRRFCTEYGLDANRAGGFLHLLRTGRAILIVDGFDELASTFGLEKARLALERVLVEACAGHGRALVSSRTQFFELVSRSRLVDRELRERTAELRPPDSLEVVKKRLGRRVSQSELDEFEQYFAGLPFELATSPLAASWTAEEVASNGMRALQATQTGIEFYRWYLRRLCEREESKRLARVYINGVERSLDADHQLKWLRRVATAMLADNGYELRARTGEDLADLLSVLLTEACDDVAVESGQEELLSHAVFSSVVSGGDVGLEFVHSSVRDFFLAEALLAAGTDVSLIGVERPSPELARFLAELFLHDQDVTEPVISYWLEHSSHPRLWRILVAVGSLQSTHAESLTAYERGELFTRLAGGDIADELDLSGVEFHRVDLRSMSFRRATLAGTRFIDCDLADVSFSGAQFEETYLVGCVLSGADFHDVRAHSAYVGEEFETVARSEDQELTNELVRLSESAYHPVVDETSSAYDLGSLVGEVMRYFVPKGRQPDRSVLRETIFKKRAERRWVQSELIPILMKRAGVLTQGRPQRGNESLYLADVARAVSWFDGPAFEDQELMSILEAVSGRSPTEQERRDFAVAVAAA